MAISRETRYTRDFLLSTLRKVWNEGCRRSRLWRDAYPQLLAFGTVGAAPMANRSRQLRLRFLLFIAVAVVGGTPQVQSAPTINVWYGNEQSFGTLGNPQQWVNILGTVSGPSVTSLTYSLNGGPSLALAIGPSMTPPGAAPCPMQDKVHRFLSNWKDMAHRFLSDCRSNSFAHCWRHALGWLSRSLRQSSPSYPRRLFGPGDFNVELDVSMLREGSNTLTLTAIDNFTDTSTALVAVNYTKGRTWPLPYSVDWSRVSDIPRAVQILDGRWTKTSDGLRTVSMGYDRLFAVGDVKWTDYEITVPITIHSIDSVASDNPTSVGPGFGLITHWRGHSFTPIHQCQCSQPRCGWLPAGATGWYEYGGQEPGFHIQGVSTARGSMSWRLEFNTRYVWKMRSETLGKRQCCNYRIKFWKGGDPEPAKWDLEGFGATDSLTSGSIVLDAHHVDATFGNISIIPGPFKGAASVAVDPDP